MLEMVRREQRTAKLAEIMFKGLEKHEFCLSYTALVTFTNLDTQKEILNLLATYIHKYPWSEAYYAHDFLIEHLRYEEALPYQDIEELEDVLNEALFDVYRRKNERPRGPVYHAPRKEKVHVVRRRVLNHRKSFF